MHFPLSFISYRKSSYIGAWLVRHPIVDLHQDAPRFVHGTFYHFITFLLRNFAEVTTPSSSSTPSCSSTTRSLRSPLVITWPTFPVQIQVPLSHPPRHGTSRSIRFRPLMAHKILAQSRFCSFIPLQALTRPYMHAVEFIMVLGYGRIELVTIFLLALTSPCSVSLFRLIAATRNNRFMSSAIIASQLMTAIDLPAGDIDTKYLDNFRLVKNAEGVTDCYEIGSPLTAHPRPYYLSQKRQITLLPLAIGYPKGSRGCIKQRGAGRCGLIAQGSRALGPRPRAQPHDEYLRTHLLYNWARVTDPYPLPRPSAHCLALQILSLSPALHSYLNQPQSWRRSSRVCAKISSVSCVQNALVH
ncbi:hypothetical protein J6590_067513 [Homalodisca vitripennis]|nr:hypothetical protein J6590_067513 [Homalodisca vitripennis]